jgi:tRNA A37 threonylcarbamoyladenosine dehydratase
VYSTEAPIKPSADAVLIKDNQRPAPGSIAFVPSVAGLIIAGEVIRDLTGVRV